MTGAERTLLAMARQMPRSADVQVDWKLRLAQRKTAEARTAFTNALDIEPRSVDALTGLVALDAAARNLAAARARVDDNLGETAA